MDVLKDLGQWWNLIYILPFAAGVCQLLLAVIGVGLESGGDHGTEVDHDVGLDHDVSADHDLGVDHEVDHDLDVSHDLDHDVDHDLDVSHDLDHDLDVSHEVHGATHIEAGLFMEVLTFFGVGKVPLTLLLQMFCFTWGALGYIANQILQVNRQPDLLIWPSLAISLVSSTLVTRSAANWLGKLMPTKGPQAVRKRDLAGRMGEVIFTVTESSGLVYVYDDSGTSHQLSCRVRPGDDPIPRGAEVVLLGYDRKGDWFWVDEWKDEAETRRMMEELDELAESIHADA